MDLPGRKTMRAAGLVFFGLMVLGSLIVGCRTAQPELRPPKQPEVANVPPLTDARYDTATYPKEAFNNQDIFRRRDLTNQDPSVMPTRGMMGPGGNMMNSGRPY
jgi:hypothetical protein